MKKILFVAIVFGVCVGKSYAHERLVEVSTNSILYPAGTLCIRYLDTYDNQKILSERPISADEYISQLTDNVKNLDKQKLLLTEQAEAVQRIKQSTVPVEEQVNP